MCLPAVTSEPRRVPSTWETLNEQMSCPGGRERRRRRGKGEGNGGRDNVIQLEFSFIRN